MNPLLLLLLLSSSWAQYCPLEETISPACICRDHGVGPMMQCSRVLSGEELIPPIKATDGKDMFALAILDSSLLYLPGNLFKNTNYKKVMFVNTQIMALSDSELAFEGLEDHLEELRASGASYITTWDWSQLRNLQHLQLIDIHSIAMHSLDTPFPPLRSLRSLGVSKAEISFLHPEAFAGLDSLNMLILNENEISEMHRSMLPNPAKKLYMIKLNGNKLSSLPGDMFTGMPNLREVYLSDNKFVTLDEEAFKRSMPQLQVLEMTGNPFVCDCRLQWLVDTLKPIYFDGNCEHPKSLKGHAVKYMVRNVLWCF